MHSENEPPLVRRYGTRVLLNNLVQVRYRKFSKIHKNTPVRPCLSVRNYFKTECRLSLLSDIHKKICGCIDRVVQNMSYNFTETNFCGNLTYLWDDFDKMAERKACIQKANKLYLEQYQKKCPRACLYSSFGIRRLFTMPLSLYNAKNVQEHLSQSSGVQSIFEQLNVTELSSEIVLKTSREAQTMNSTKMNVTLLKKKLRKVLECSDGSSNSTCSSKINTHSRYFKNFFMLKLQLNLIVLKINLSRRI